MRRFATLVAAFALSACGSRVPEIARDLPANYAEGQKIFESRLKRKFPVGTSEAEVVKALKNDGFEIVESTHGQFATFNDKSFPVNNVWNIGWETDAGQITKIWGIYGGRGP